ncbi:MAG: type II toxin-antitoxin system RelE/ParE family toxin [Candidatus Aminicenantes bacterium]|nr:type II toxin-antitoxin system RelE/ParE family toxin [Candidatus Aminicenantes bacterium]
MTYELAWNENVKDDLRRLSKNDAVRIIAAVKEHLAENPLAHGKPLKGMFKGLYRYRRGDYRVIFAVDHEARLVRILHIKHRKNAYR